MNFLFDHDVPQRAGDVLRQEGHSILFLQEVLPPNSTDEDILKYAADHELMLVTCNRDDFLQLAASMLHHGLIVLVRRHTRLAECSSLLRLIRTAGESGLLKNINFA